MENQLKSLVHLDIDAVHAFAQGAERIKSQSVHSVEEQLARFKEDHERHVEKLSAAISRMGGEVPVFQQDFRGYLIEGFTALRGLAGMEGVLKAMRLNERLVFGKYAEALGWPLPQDIIAIIREHVEDEKRHLRFIEDTLENEVWKLGRKVA